MKLSDTNVTQLVALILCFVTRTLATQCVTINNTTLTLVLALAVLVTSGTHMTKIARRAQEV